MEKTNNTIISKGTKQHIGETKDFNATQNLLFQRAMFGLSIYSESKIKSMNYMKRKRIIKVHKKTQHLLNMWKQELLIELTNNFFEKYFKSSPITKALLDNFDSPDPSFRCTLSNKSLHLSKKEIAMRLCAEGILPQDFFNPHTLKTIKHENRILS